MLSSPTAKSNRLRAAMRGGLWSSFSVPGAGILISEEPYCDAGHNPESPIGVVRTDPQKSPAWNCWSGVMPETSTMESVPFGPLPQLPPAHGTGPATRPLSYRQLKPNQGPSFQG